MTANDQTISQEVPSVLPRDEALRYVPTSKKRYLFLREAPLFAFYHLRLLNWWLFLLMFLSFLVACALLYFQLHLDDPQKLEQAAQVSRFVVEAGTGLLAGMLASSLISNDPLVDITIATRTGIRRVLSWRLLLSLFLLLLASSTYLFWSLSNNVRYAHSQNLLFLLLVWLVPILIMGTLGLAGSLLTRNAALGMAIAAMPMMGALFLSPFLLPSEATHPFLIPYTSWGYDASDWWSNRWTLLAIAGGLSIGILCWLRREERLLGKTH